jgi:hypothetical protein
MEPEPQKLGGKKTILGARKLEGGVRIAKQ